MILFCMSHPMSLYQFVTLRFTKYRNEKVYFLMREATANSIFVQNMGKNKIFEKIISYREFFEGDNVNWEIFIKQYFDKIFIENNIRITQFKEILISFDVCNNFYLYCCFNNKEVSFVESNFNQFKDRNRYIINTVYHHGSIEHENINRKYDALCGEHSFVIKRYLYSVENKIIDEKDENMDFLSAFLNLSDIDKGKIKDCLEYNGTVFKENCNLILLNSIGYGQPKCKLVGKQYYHIYQLIADYYFDEYSNIYFKNHPASPPKDFDETIKKYEKVLDAKLPIEFYTLDRNFSVNKLISANSSGNEKISSFVKEEITLGDSVLFHFRELHKLYITYAYDMYLGKSKGYHYYGISKELITNFLYYALNRKQDVKGINTSILKGNIFTVIGNEIAEIERKNIRRALLESDELTKVCFFCSENEMVLLFEESTELLENVVSITIHKRKLREDILGDLVDEKIYFFCKSKEIREKIKRFSLHKILLHSGIELFINSTSDYEDRLEKLELMIKIQNNEIEKLKKINK